MKVKYLIALVSAIALSSSLAYAKRDRRDPTAAELDLQQAEGQSASGQLNELWNKHHEHHQKKCQTKTVIVFAPCTKREHKPYHTYAPGL